MRELSTRFPFPFVLQSKCVDFVGKKMSDAPGLKQCTCHHYCPFQATWPRDFSTKKKLLNFGRPYLLNA